MQKRCLSPIINRDTLCSRSHPHVADPDCSARPRDLQRRREFHHVQRKLPSMYHSASKYLTYLIHNTRSFRCARHVSVTSSAAFHGNGKHSADPTARALTFKRPDQSSESARSASRSSVDFSTAAARDFTSSSRRPLYAPDPGIVGEAACCSCRLAAAGCCVHPCDQTRSYSRNLYHFSTTSAARHRQRSLR